MTLETKIIGIEGSRRWLARIGSFTATAPRKQEAIDKLRTNLGRAHKAMMMVRSER